MPKFSDVVIAPGFTGTVSNGFGVVFYVSNITNPGEFQGSPGPSRQGRTPKNPFNTIQAAIDEAVAGRGDVIVIQRGTYVEDLAVNKVGLTLLGAVPYGYPDHVIVQGATVFEGRSISAYNMEFFSASTTRACVKVGNETSESPGSYFKNCSFSSDGTTEPACGVLLVGGNNHSVIGCRIIDTTRGIIMHAGITSFLSGVRILDNEFLEQTTVDIGTGASGDTSTYVGGPGDDAVGVLNLIIRGNYFGGGVTIPTDFINIVGTSSGNMSGNEFASTTYAIGTIVIPTGIQLGSNLTLAGWSIAVPA